MKISRFIFNPFGENTYIAYDESTRQAAIIDPGMVNAEEEQAVRNFIDRNSLTLTHAINTHVHIDHTFGSPWVKRTYGLGIEANNRDAFLGLTRTEQARMFHLPYELEPLTIERQLNGGDVITLGTGSTLHVIEVPGHSPGSIALYSPEAGVVFTGDALFPGSIGRTDVPGGDHAELVDSIKQRLLTLPPDTVVLPGHGDETTIGREKQLNPFLK